MSAVDFPFPPSITPKRHITDGSIASPPKKRRKTNITLHSKLVEEFTRHSHIRNSVNLTSYHAKKQNIKTLCPYHDMLPVLNIMHKEQIFTKPNEIHNANNINNINIVNINCNWCCSGSPYKSECRNLSLKAKELYEYKFNLNDIAIPFMNAVVLGGPTANICININHNSTTKNNTFNITFAPLQKLSLLQRNSTHNIAVKAVACGTFKRNLQPVPGPCRITKILDGDAGLIPIGDGDMFMKISTCMVKQRRRLQGSDSVLGIGFDCASTTNWKKARIYWMHKSLQTIRDKQTKKIVEKKQIINRDLRFSLLIPHEFAGEINVFMIGIAQKKTYTINTETYNNIEQDDVKSKINPNQINEITNNINSTNSLGTIVSNSDNNLMLCASKNVNNENLPIKTMLQYPFDTNILNNNSNSNSIYPPILASKIDDIRCIEDDLESGHKNYIESLHSIDFGSENHQTLASKWIRICLDKYSQNEDIYHSYLLNLLSSLIASIGDDKTVGGLKRMWMNYNNLENEWSFLHMICSKNLLYLFQSIVNLFVSVSVKHELLLSTAYINKNSKLKISPIYCCIVNSNYEFTKYLFGYFLNNLQAHEILNILNESELINYLINYHHTQTLQQLINVNSCQINPFLTVKEIQSMLIVINKKNNNNNNTQQYLINPLVF